MENRCLTPQIIYCVNVSNNKDNDSKFYYGLTESHLRRDMVTTRDLSDMSGTEMTLNCRNISGILHVLIKFQPSNGALSEKYTETQNHISVSYV